MRKFYMAFGSKIENESKTMPVKMLIYIIDRFISGLWLTSISGVTFFAIFAWPIAIILAIVQFLVLLLCLPLILFVLLPVSMLLIRRGILSPAIWFSAYFISSFLFSLAFLLLSEPQSALHADQTSGLALIILVCSIAGTLIPIRNASHMRE